MSTTVNATYSIFETLFESLPDAIVLTAVNGTIKRINLQTEKLFGFARGDLIDKSVEVLLPERFRNSHPLQRSSYTSHPHNRPMGLGLELYGRRQDGTEFPVDIMLSPMDTAEGKSIVCVIRDISQRRRIEQTLNEREQQFRLLVENV